MRFPRQEYWCGLLFSSPGDLPDSGRFRNSGIHISCLASRFLNTEPPVKPTWIKTAMIWKSIYWFKRLFEMCNECKFHFCCYCLVLKSCPTLCYPKFCSTPGFPVLHYPRVCSNSCPFESVSQLDGCYLTISFSATLFFCLQSSPASESFPMSWHFASGCQNIGTSTSA